MTLPRIVDWKPYTPRDPLRWDVIETVRQVTAEPEYAAGDITLRQLYYQLVARGHTERWVTGRRTANSQPMYDWVGDVVSRSRRGGLLPIDLLVDRGRSSRAGRFTRHDVDVDDAMQRLRRETETAPRRLLGVDPWFRQPNHVSVWIEKDALVGVIERTCAAWGVSWYACKGYSSLSGLTEWIDQVRDDWVKRGS